MFSTLCIVLIFDSLQTYVAVRTTCEWVCKTWLSVRPTGNDGARLKNASHLPHCSTRHERIGALRPTGNCASDHKALIHCYYPVLVHRNKFTGVDVVHTRRSVYQPGSAQHSQIRSSTDACQGLVRVHLPPRKRRSKRKIAHAHLLFYFIDDYRNAQVWYGRRR